MDEYIRAKHVYKLVYRKGVGLTEIFFHFEGQLSEAIEEAKAFCEDHRLGFVHVVRAIVRLDEEA